MTETYPKKVGRPKNHYSRRRYQVAVKALNRILTQEKLPAVLTLRACELLIYVRDGGLLPGGMTHRDARSARSIVMEHNMELAVKKSIDDELEAERLERERRNDEEVERIFEQATAGMTADGDQDGDNE